MINHVRSSMFNLNPFLLFYYIFIINNIVILNLIPFVYSQIPSQPPVNLPPIQSNPMVQQAISTMIGTIPSKILSLLTLANVKKIKFMLKKKPSVKKSKKKKKHLGEGDDEGGNGIDDDGNDTEDEDDDDEGDDNDDVNQRLKRNNLNRAADGLFNDEADKSFVVFMGNSNVQVKKG